MAPKGVGSTSGTLSCVLVVELLHALVEPLADALELLLLHPHGGCLARRADHEAEAALTGLADRLRVDGDGLAKIVPGSFHGANYGRRCSQSHGVASTSGFSPTIRKSP